MKTSTWDGQSVCPFAFLTTNSESTYTGNVYVRVRFLLRKRETRDFPSVLRLKAPRVSLSLVSGLFAPLESPCFSDFNLVGRSDIVSFVKGFCVIREENNLSGKAAGRAHILQFEKHNLTTSTGCPYFINLYGVSYHIHLPATRKRIKQVFLYYQTMVYIKATAVALLAAGACTA